MTSEAERAGDMTSKVRSGGVARSDDPQGMEVIPFVVGWMSTSPPQKVSLPFIIYLNYIMSIT